MVAVAGPVFERGAIAHSYACRAGRGQHAALRAVRGWLGQSDWFWNGDVSKYYDSIDHSLLRSLLARRFRERRLLSLFDNLLSSYARVDGKGLPIGALTSQYLGNFYLDPFDHWIVQTRKIVRYTRYMDDVLAICDRVTLAALRPEAEATLEGLGLTLKHGGRLNRCMLGVPYLGFVLYPDRIRLNRQGRRRLRRRWKNLEASFAAGGITEAELQSRAESLFAHARFGDDVSWRRAVAAFTRIREAHEPAPGPAGRFVEQHGRMVPLGEPQQEQAG